MRLVEWFLEQQGLIQVVTGIISTLLVGALAVLGKVLWTRLLRPAWIDLRARHTKRMKAKYSEPCTRPHVENAQQVPERPAFIHPARFEVTALQKGNERAHFLVNVGKGHAYGVVAETDGLGNCTVRGAASWDMISAGERKRITIVSDYMDFTDQRNISVSWTDARGANHVEDAPLDESATRLLNPFRS